jgi:CheY-like chemotaxis protein
VLRIWRTFGYRNFQLFLFLTKPRSFLTAGRTRWGKRQPERHRDCSPVAGAAIQFDRWEGMQICASFFTARLSGDSRANVASADEETTPRQEGASFIMDHNSQRYTKMVISESKGCILIVDDNDYVREVLAELLESEGYHALQAGGAPKALQILRQQVVIDALVTDLSMPGGDGITLIRHARELRHDLPAILLTGYAEQVTSLAMTADGDFHVLGKPVESESLIEQLDRLMKAVDA